MSNICQEDLNGIGLYLGCGHVHWAGWTNLDNSPNGVGEFPSGADVFSDAQTLPFKTESVDVICAIHLIEHLYKWDAETALLDWFRVLKPGGRLILELPCMDKVFSILMAYLNAKEAPKAEFTWWALWGDPNYKDPGMAHRWGYSAFEMHKLLEKVGFSNIIFCEPKYHFPQRDMRFEARK